MNQSEMIAKYNDLFRPKFNQDLFNRHDDDIIEAIKNVILSCERESSFTIKVLEFDVIDNYDEINHILWQYEDNIINKTKKVVADSPEEAAAASSKKSSSKNNKKKDNQFEFINLKDSDIKLIKVTYFLQIFEKKNGIVRDTVTVYIAIPRVIHKFYYRINGNVYSAMYQIVDASTYNNTNSNSKKQTITFKTMFMPIRTYRYYGTLTDINHEHIPCIYYLGNMFKKSLLMMKYIFAKMGYYETLNFFGVPDIHVIQSEQLESIDKENCYVFPVGGLYITIPKFIFNNSPIAQSLVYTICITLNSVKNLKYSDVFTNSLWIKSLGSEFASKDIDTVYDKGLSILNSLEMIYDINTKNDLKLSPEDKDDIYRVLRWIMCEFNSLRLKDNLDISTKKVRYAEYLASLYASKLTQGIYRLSDKGDKADINTVRRAVQIPPLYLLNAIVRCQLVNYKGCANDLDSLFALKFTYKGVSGIGEKSNAIPASYRSIHPSHLGRVDLDSSSPSDPGISGTICPLTSLYGSYFTEFEEPSTWREELCRMIDQYRSMEAKTVMARLVNDLSISQQPVNNVLTECMDICQNLIHYCNETDKTSELINGYDMFGDGLIYYTEE